MFSLLPLSLSAQAKKQKITITENLVFKPLPYVMVFNDEFDGNSLDTSKWYTYYPYGTNVTKDSCSFCRTHIGANVYKDENAVLSNGVLQLWSKEEKMTWFDRDFTYTSAMINSKQTFTTYGRYEIKCKLPKGAQQWPAFWIFGWNTEIDIFEFICSGPSKLEFSIHKWLSKDCPRRKKDNGSPCYSSQSGKVDFEIDFSADFHSFAMEYDPFMIRYYIDDIMVRYVCRYYDKKGRPITKNTIQKGDYLLEPSFPILGEPVAVIANQMICTSHKEKNPIFPNVMEIDYIRVYQRDFP